MDKSLQGPPTGLTVFLALVSPSNTSSCIAKRQRLFVQILHESNIHCTIIDDSIGLIIPPLYKANIIAQLVSKPSITNRHIISSSMIDVWVITVLSNKGPVHIPKDGAPYKTNTVRCA
jgi:hypothetical protein